MGGQVLAHRLALDVRMAYTQWNALEISELDRLADRALDHLERVDVEPDEQLRGRGLVSRIERRPFIWKAEGGDIGNTRILRGILEGSPGHGAKDEEVTFAHLVYGLRSPVDAVAAHVVELHFDLGASAHWIGTVVGGHSDPAHNARDAHTVVAEPFGDRLDHAARVDDVVY